MKEIMLINGTPVFREPETAIYVSVDRDEFENSNGTCVPFDVIRENHLSMQLSEDHTEYISWFTREQWDAMTQLLQILKQCGVEYQVITGLDPADEDNSADDED